MPLTDFDMIILCCKAGFTQLNKMLYMDVLRSLAFKTEKKWKIIYYCTFLLKETTQISSGWRFIYIISCTYNTS